MDTLSTLIKKATKKEHQYLEKKVVQRLKAIDTKEDYAELLRYFYNYFNRLEEVAIPFINEKVWPGYRQRRSSEFLKKDIMQLREIPYQLTDVRVPRINNTLEALGALYVMEGSIMGGVIIVKMLAKKRITRGISFFSGYGEDTHTMWRNFQKVMDQHAVTGEEQQVLIQKARETFEYFSNLFERAPVLLDNENE